MYSEVQWDTVKVGRYVQWDTVEVSEIYSDVHWDTGVIVGHLPLVQ